MSKKSDKRSGFPGGANEDELQAEFEAWDEGFDGLFGEPTSAGKPQAGPARARSEAQDFELDLALDDDEPELEVEIEPEATVVAAGRPGTAGHAPGRPRALGNLLGQVAPLDVDDIDDGDSDPAIPPPFEQDSGGFELPPDPSDAVDGHTSEDDDDEAVLTSAARPMRDARPPAQPRARPGSVMEAFQPLTEDEDDDEFDPFADPEEGEFAQVTKVVEVDESLLAAAMPEEQRAQPKRRTPAIVRRDDLERMRAEQAARMAEIDDDDDDDDDAFGSMSTQLLSMEQLESLNEEVAAGAAAEAEATATVEVSVDDDFYDDIVIAEGSEAREDSMPEITPTGRRVSRYVVRRDSIASTPDAARPKPVVRPRRRRTRNSEQELASHLESTRSMDPDSTLDLRMLTDGAPEPGGEDGDRGRRAEDIQAIIDRAAQELRSQRQAEGGRARTPPLTPPPAPRTGSLPTSAQVSGELPGRPATGVSLEPVGQAADDGGFEDFELDWEVDAETSPVGAAPLPASPRAPVLDDLDAIPGLPDPVLPASDPSQWPALDIASLQVPEQVAPLSREERATHGQDLAGALLRYERALPGVTESAEAARLHLEAGRVSERLGDADRAREHYESALQFAPRMAPALRGLRRVERVQGHWSEAVQHLDRELAGASALERRALMAHRIDVLMAHGERELAGDTVAELLGEGRADPRALLARIELALTEGRHAEAVDAVGRLAELLGSSALRGSLARVRGMLCERTGGDAIGAFAEAAAQGARTAALAAAGAARDALDQAGGGQGDAAVPLRLVESARVAGAADRAGAGGEQGTGAAVTAALAWRRSMWAEAAQRAGAAQPAAAASGPAGDLRWEAVTEAATLAPHETVLHAELAALAGARGDHAGAAQRYQHLGAIAPTESQQAAALALAAHHLDVLDRGAEAAELLDRVQTLDPSSPAPGRLLLPALERAGAVDALIELDRRAVAADPEGALLERVRAARRLVDQGHVDQAVAELEAGRALAPAAPALQQALAETLARAGRAHAHASLLSALADAAGAGIDPDMALWRAARSYETHARGVIAAQDATGASEPQRAVREGALASALEAWNRVLDVDPEAPAAHLASAVLAELLGDADVLEDALARAQAAIADPGHAATLGLARVALATGRPAALPAEDPERLDELLREVAAVWPADPRPALARGALAAAEGRFADVAATLEDRATVVGDGAGATALRYRAAALHLDPADQPAEAAVLLEEVLRARPGLAPAQELLRAARLRMGASAPVELPVGPGDRATSSADAAMRGAIEDGFARLVREAELSLDHLGDPDRALELYDQALAARPGDSRAWALVRPGLFRAAEVAGAFDRMVALVSGERERAEARGHGPARADAHEELARIEGMLRGDAAAAVAHARAALAADPGRVSAMRALERAHLAAQDWESLLALYGRMQPGSDREAAALTLCRARLAERLDVDRALALYQQALEHDPRWPGCLPALLHLEAAARAALAGDAADEGAHRRERLAALAALELAAADAMTGDPLARAMFATRAGEVALALGELDEAVARFREASEAASGEAGDAGAGDAGEHAGAGYGAALFGWRTAALRAGLWLDVAEAAQREARLPEAAAERVALWHLAGVALMDRALHGERAQQALAGVLGADPGHDDAFARMRVLLEEQGEHERLAQLLVARLETETRNDVRAYLYRELAAQRRNFLDDREGARECLRAVLALAPGDRESIASLADLAWELGDWEDAAAQLARRARMETDPQVLRLIFYRLGTIYADRLPEPALARKAFKEVLRHDPSDQGALEGIVRLGMSTGDWKLALAACERLVRVAADDEARVPHLHRMAEIYATGLEDPVRAERAYRTALDRAPTSAAALAALVRFYEDRGDPRSTRVHLDRLAAAMRVRVAGRPADGVAYRVIAQAMEARAKAGVRGSLGPARCAAELSLLLDAGDERERALVERTAGERARLSGLSEPGADELMFPAIVSHAARQVFGQLGDRIAKHLGADLRRHGVGRGNRLRDRGQPAVAAFEALAADLGMDAPALYVSEEQPRALAVEPTSPVSVVLGAELLGSMDEAGLRFVAGRALVPARAGLTAALRLSADELAVFLVALLRQFEPELEVPGVDTAVAEAEAQKMRRLIPGGLMNELRPFAVGIVGEDFDAAALWDGLVEVSNRGGLLACGSIRAAVDVLRRGRGHGSLRAALADAEIAALVSFSVSDDHAALRGVLGS